MTVLAVPKKFREVKRILTRNRDVPVGTLASIRRDTGIEELR
jgi:hypothetical protein